MNKIIEIEFSEADIKAICKARGFPYSEIKNLRMFQEFYLSDTGLEKVFSNLTEKELIYLHLINCKNAEVDIEFFKSLYYTKDPNTLFWTFHQKYNPVFKKVRDNFIRKGILIFYQKHKYWASCKLESMVFSFPKEFSNYLPIIAKPFIKKERGVYNDKIMRKMLKDFGSMFTIKDKILCFDNKKLSQGMIENWQKKNWEDEIRKLYDGNSYEEKISDYIIYILSGLKKGEWFNSDQIKNIIKMWTGKKINNDILDIGWKLGILLKSENYFCPYHDNFNIDKKYLETNEDGTVEINLKNVPFRILEIISSISHIAFKKDNLIAKPNIINLGKVSHEHPVIEWLIKNSILYKNIADIIKKKCKKQIIHNNLMIARIDDLSLMVEIKKAFNDPRKIIVLSDNYIAFPKNCIGEMESLVNKSGNIIKRVK